MKSVAAMAVLYNFLPERLAKIEAVLAGLRIKTKAVGAAEAGQKVGFLVGLRGFAATERPAESAPFGEELLILQGVDRGRMDKVLTAFQAAGIERIRYKAVVTPYNMFWSLNRLGAAMEKEHGALAKRLDEA